MRVGALAREAAEIGINYPACCGASPMLIRQVAEAVGRTTEASRFSEKMQKHFLRLTRQAGHDVPERRRDRDDDGTGRHDDVRCDGACRSRSP
jgi:hypothetical protein